MAAAQSHSTQHVVSSATVNRPKEHDGMKEQPTAVGHSAEAVGQSRSFGSEIDLSIHPPNLYVPNAYTSYSNGLPFSFSHFPGYENFLGEWNDLSLYGNAEGLNRELSGSYNNIAATRLQDGYSYNLQMPCGTYSPFSPVTKSLPVVSGDAPLYRSQQYSYPGQTYYEQVISPNIPYTTSSSAAETDLNSFVTVGLRVDPIHQEPRAAYTSSLASSGRGNFPGNPSGVSFHDHQSGCDGFRSRLWSDWPKPSDNYRPLTSVSPSLSEQASQQPRSFYGFGSRSVPCKDSSYAHGVNHGFGGGWNGLDYGRPCSLGNGSLCSCSGANEQNRGPRASKSKRQISGEDYFRIDNNKNISLHGKMHVASYNSPDLLDEYVNAKFFVIKSYSEDNIHKSIKYGVWASTPNGNQKLNAAYHEAKEKLNNCPVFLFFSVNASAQFCGVAEMVGPVDFEKSVDYWQQDKWTGQFPVKWHILKDVPNSQFRHIVLENNDNKPVTNSRDTQEVKLEQGTEMINIFKNYETNISILADFDFYEGRQKALQERKSKEHINLLGIGMVEQTRKTNDIKLTNEFTEKMSKSFAQVVKLKECSKDTSVADRAGPRSKVPINSGKEAEGSILTVLPGVQTT
ncbi:hypothetical protein ACJIZ3_021024 [Penstemon smallii]|uniref:YTH domain-containing family protein n=1 Tax=Penstemon smallii TaxID=265156 RepID=A0ABD3SKV6_9LAMI